MHGHVYPICFPLAHVCLYRWLRRKCGFSVGWNSDLWWRRQSGGREFRGWSRTLPACCATNAWRCESFPVLCLRKTRRWKGSPESTVGEKFNQPKSHLLTEKYLTSLRNFVYNGPLCMSRPFSFVQLFFILLGWKYAKTNVRSCNC